MKKKSFDEFINEEREEKTKVLKVEISNLSNHQYEGFKVLLSSLEYLGAVGASRILRISADGDGGFRPTVKYGDGSTSKDIDVKMDLDKEEIHLTTNFE